MSAVLKTQEPSAQYLAALRPGLVEHFELVATAPGGVARLRQLILTLGVGCKLVPMDPSDDPASGLLTQVRAEKMQLVASGKITQTKPLEEITAPEIPFNLPSGWTWVRLRTLLQKIGSGSTPLGGKEVYVSSGIKFLRSQNVWNDGLRLDGVAFITPKIHAQMAGTVVRANDLLFNITGASIGRCSVVPDGFDEANVSQHVTILRPVMQALNPYLHKVMISRRVQQSVMDVQVGVSREGLSVAKLSRFLIPLPPLAEQSRIVARVEELMRLCDALETKGRLQDAQHTQLLNALLGTLTDSASAEELAVNWQRVAAHFDLLLDRPEAIDALEGTILQLAVRGLLLPEEPGESAEVLLERIRNEKAKMRTGEASRAKTSGTANCGRAGAFPLRSGWAWARFGDYVLELCTGPFGSLVHKDDYATNGIPLVNPSHMINGRITHDPAVTVSPAVAERLSAYRLSAGDVLLARRGEVGRYALVTKDEEGWLCGTGSFFVRLSSECDRRYFGLMLEDPRLRRHLLGESVGATMTNLNQRILLDAVLAIPPLAEQRRIVARVNQLRRLCADLREKLASARATQVRLADALVESAGSAD